MNDKQKVSFNSIKDIENIDPNNVFKVVKLQNVMNFANEKIEYPGLTKAQICGKLNISPSGLDRSMIDLNMKGGKSGGFYRYDIPVKKSQKSKISESVAHCENCNQD